MSRKKSGKCPACGQTVPGLRKGRPTGLSPALAEEMERLAGEGYRDGQICDVLGIATSTFSDWKLRARAGDEPYATLMWCVLRARAEHVKEVEDEVREGVNIRGFPDPSARIAYLKSRDDAWTTRVKVERVAESLLAQWLENLEMQEDPAIFADYIRPAMLRAAGVPVEIQALPAEATDED